MSEHAGPDYRRGRNEVQPPWPNGVEAPAGRPLGAGERSEKDEH